MKSGDGLKNLGIIGEKAAITYGQDLPFFEVTNDMFDKDSVTRELLVFGFFGVAQRAIFLLLFGDKNACGMDVLKALVARRPKSELPVMPLLFLRMLKS